MSFSNNEEQNQIITVIQEALQNAGPRKAIPDMIKVTFLLVALALIVMVWSAISERLEEKRKGKSKSKKGAKKGRK